MILSGAPLSRQDKIHTINRLFKDSSPNYSFFLLLIVSTVIIALGIIQNNIPVVIGGMLVAPLLSPILSFALGIVVGDPKLMKRSGITLLQSIAGVILFALLIGLLITDKQITTELLLRTDISLTYLLIAIFSGIAVSYAMIRPSVSEIMPGVAITVSLMPPLVAVGLSLSFMNLTLAINALILFALNLLGIIFAVIIVFALYRFYEAKNAIDQQIRLEEQLKEKQEEENKKKKIENLEKQVDEVKDEIEKEKQQISNNN